MRLGLERAMFGNDYFRGRVNYTVESIGMVDMKSTASQIIGRTRARLDFQIGVGLTLILAVAALFHQGAALIHRCGFRPGCTG